MDIPVRRSNDSETDRNDHLTSFVGKKFSSRKNLFQPITPQHSVRRSSGGLFKLLHFAVQNFKQSLQERDDHWAD